MPSDQTTRSLPAPFPSPLLLHSVVVVGGEVAEKFLGRERGWAAPDSSLEGWGARCVELELPQEEL